MAGFLPKAIVSVVVFAYGLFNVALYSLIAIKKGLYFKKPTEKQTLELKLCAYDPYTHLPSSIFHRPSSIKSPSLLGPSHVIGYQSQKTVC
jgi:hypothetical protein